MNLWSYNPCIEERIINFLRLEAPANTRRVALWFQMTVLDVDQILCGMVAARQLRRVWKGIEDDFWKAEEFFDLVG